ncbi:5136_t:CDS:2 [Diversispora eburnea]|uniref:5136_t:CDS:1 n=1 Tax=Diversispora eburnea TaxID=1213867 RepID=A0A9N9DF27_9GLOM|nr:5136_t:CDS:2 [Diversispora eburnea]
MANKISTGLLIMILNNVRPQDLHSSSLVNRNWCKIIYLTLLNLRPEQVIAIFNNNNFGRKGFDANKPLCKIVESVPGSLETIEIRM